MKEAFDRELSGSGVNPIVANALVSVFCERNTGPGTAMTPTVKWRLWNCKERPGNRRTMSAKYHADDTERYFFEYRLGNTATILQYNRFDDFRIAAGIHDFATQDQIDIDSRDPNLLEAICVMLYSIMQIEYSDVQFSANIDVLRTQYRAMFPNRQESLRVIEYLSDLLGKSINPIYQDTNPIVFPTVPASSSVLCQPLLTNESVGHWDRRTGKLMLTPEVEISIVNKMYSHDNEWDWPIAYLTATRQESARGRVFVAPACYSITGNRSFTDEELARIQTIPNWYVETSLITSVADAISASRIFDSPFSNALLRGPSGSGKTAGTQVISSMLRLPYGHLTCFREMEMEDLVSKFIPRTSSPLDSLEQKVEFYQSALQDRGLDYPKLSVISAMPDAAYFQISGVEKDDATEKDCLLALFTKLHSAVIGDKKIKSGNDPNFLVVYSDLVKALENGWLIEIQESATIRNPGVLIGLNSILEHGKLILTDGRSIRRHPDCIIVFTNNYRSYAGVNATNQSTLSRLEIKVDLPHPTTDEMINRIKRHVPMIADDDARLIVQTIETIHKSCSEEIQDGSVGTREAIAWAKMAYIKGDLMVAAEMTLIPSCTEDTDDQTLIRTSVLESLMGVQGNAA